MRFWPFHQGLVHWWIATPLFLFSTLLTFSSHRAILLADAGCCFTRVFVKPLDSATCIFLPIQHHSRITPRFASFLNSTDPRNICRKRQKCRADPKPRVHQRKKARHAARLALPPRDICRERQKQRPCHVARKRPPLCGRCRTPAFLQSKKRRNSPPQAAGCSQV